MWSGPEYICLQFGNCEAHLVFQGYLYNSQEWFSRLDSQLDVNGNEGIECGLVSLTALWKCHCLCARRVNIDWNTRCLLMVWFCDGIMFVCFRNEHCKTHLAFQAHWYSSQKWSLHVQPNTMLQVSSFITMLPLFVCKESEHWLHYAMFAHGMILWWNHVCMFAKWTLWSIPSFPGILIR